ncbi:MAG: stage 0 sporulation family protein [Eubacteriales bacterium]
MTEIITVRFKPSGRQYFFDPQGKQYQSGDELIVETSRGKEFGICIIGNHEKDDKSLPQPLRPVLYEASSADKARMEKNQERAQWGKKVCLEKIQQHKLDMSLVGVENSFEGSKMLFYFTAEGRVDFRALVKDLAFTLHTRIELRQIGVRDECKMLGGLGICGRPYCCNQFLDKFAPVSIKMAKTQNLSLNPTKISGSCGRLMCCLKYEQDAYVDLLKSTPRSDSFVETPDGAGTITYVNLLRQQVSVRLESDPSVAVKYYNSEIVVVRSGRGKRPEGYVQPPLAVLEKQRKVAAEVIGSPQKKNNLASALDAMLNPPVQKQRKEKREGENFNQGKSEKYPAKKQQKNKTGTVPPPTQKPKKKAKGYRPNTTRPNRNNKRGKTKNESEDS